ncbi:MAG: hypothetical protein Q7R70_05615 [Candidatus Diapherotrites archaeon]|nr:hypothetical protein [Candidatus Diapherotrites archaeon]
MVLKSKLVHLRLNASMVKEIQKACVDFHYQSTADFLRESAREKLRFLERQKALKKISGKEEKEELSEKKLSEAVDETQQEKHELHYFS